MKYKDEEIIALRNQNLKKKYINTKTGMYVGAQLVMFHEQRIFDGYVLDLPEESKQLEQDLAERKYPSKDRPQLIFDFARHSVDFTFSRFDKNMVFDQIETKLEHFKLIFQTVQPANQFLNQEFFIIEQGKVGWMDFKSYAMDGAVYNLLAVISHQTSWILGMFHCPYSSYMLWKPVMTEMLKTIREESANER